MDRGLKQEQNTCDSHFEENSLINGLMNSEMIFLQEGNRKEKGRETGQYLYNLGNEALGNLNLTSGVGTILSDLVFKG